jgi:hypothetical protein
MTWLEVGVLVTWRRLPIDGGDGILPPAQKRLRELKARISAQSKKNFVLDRDVRYLDTRIALLIQNRMALDEVRPDRFWLIPSTVHKLLSL